MPFGITFGITFGSFFDVFLWSSCKSENKAPAAAGALFWRFQAAQKQHFLVLFLHPHLEPRLEATFGGFWGLFGVPFGSQRASFSAFIFEPVFRTLNKNEMAQNGPQKSNLCEIMRRPGGMCGTGVRGYRGFTTLRNYIEECSVV